MTVSDIFDLAAAQNIGLTVLTSATDRSEMLEELPSTARSYVETHLAAGKAIIIPEAPVTTETGEKTTAWWVYDPMTGALSDQLADGRGGSAVLFGPMLDDALLKLRILMAGRDWVKIGACLAAIASFTNDLLGGGSAAELGGDTVGGILACA